jgi:AcrR family transcriptional regulator/transposase-like protein
MSLEARYDAYEISNDHEFLALDLVWRLLHSPDGRNAFCSKCDAARPFHRVSGRRAYACDRCGRHVYPAAETPFAGSPIELSAWFQVTALKMDDLEPLKPRRIAERLGFGYKRAWLMSKRIDETLEAGGGKAELLHTIATSWREILRLDNAHLGQPETPEDRIRAAACRVIAERGVSSARIADIAEEAGLSPGSIHYYFRSKDDMLLDAFRWAGERFFGIARNLLDEEADPTAAVSRILQMSIPSDRPTVEEYLLWPEVWVRARNHPHFMTECTSISRRWYETVLAVFRHGTREGSFTPVTALEEVCERYVAIAESLAFRSTLRYADMPAAKARRVLARFTAEQLGIPAERLDRA